MVARIILPRVSLTDVGVLGVKDLLLHVVRRICEQTRVKPTPDVIVALNHHPMLVCFQEFIVKDDRPLSMIHFSLAMCHKCGARSFPANVLCCEGFEGIGELSFEI